MNTPSFECSACQKKIDAAARVCPFCGANPETGERVDTQAILQEVFQPKTVTTSESVLEYARQRQGVVIAATVLVAFLILAGLHQFATRRNASIDADTPAVPLSEITDVTRRADDVTPIEMPQLDFQHDGDPRAMRTYIVEPGAVPPPEVVAARQAEVAANAGAQTDAPRQPQAAAPGAPPRAQQ